ncbi:MAG TPA: PilZ domain-containing protein [Pyrinomonadaceae bacterium]|nr:PilZ domain-containing protein [Pyrinomonadaceae bacterium]
MPKERSWKRIRERLELKLPVRVQCRETPAFEWVEITRLINVTPFGAGFTLKRPIERGRLVHMTIPMPRQLRVFDHLEDQYRVWALVRYVRPVSDAHGKGVVFEIGVAFLGKRPPKSYEADPTKRYEIAESVTETRTLSSNPDEVVGPLTSTDKRAFTRHNIAVDMFLETFDENGGVNSTEETVTEDISQQGATIFTSLAVDNGRFIRLTSKQFELTVYAVVRSQSTGADGVPRIHVEFIDREWPL